VPAALVMQGLVDVGRMGCSSFAAHSVSLKGKVLVTNTLLLSQLLYLGSCMYTPRWVFDKYKQIITKFIWNNKPAKVKYSTMIAKIEDGGLYVQDLETKVEAMKLNWVKKLYDTNHQAPWKTYIAQFFNMDMSTIVKSNLAEKHLPEIKEKLYVEMWKTWCKLNYTIMNLIMWKI
jgi:hypothetical protein